MVDPSPTMADLQARRAEIQKRLASLEEEVVRLRSELNTLGTEQRLPGLYLTLDVAGTSALLPTAVVLEVVRLVAIDPLPAAAPHIAGVMLYRGTPAVVVDLARRLGTQREPEMDAHMVVCGGSRTVALLVDRVRDLVEAPMLVDGAVEGGAPNPWDSSGLMAGLCRTPEGLRPLLRTSAVLSIPEDL